MIEGTDLLAMDINGKSDPFCVFRLNGDKRTQHISRICEQTLNPLWNETFKM